MSQPLPSKTDPRRRPVIWSLRDRCRFNMHSPELLAFIEARSEIGVKTYGEALHSHNGRDALLDALEEFADAAMYLEQALIEDAESKDAERSRALCLLQDWTLEATETLMALRGAR